MTKNNTKRALLMSVLSLVLCMSMLVGSTFAWFTDLAESKGNKIEAGTLQVELWEGDTNISNTKTPIFNYAKWEPGYSDYADLTIKNAGSLALKYQLVFQNIQVTGDANLAEVLEVKIGDNAPKLLSELGETTVLFEGELEAGKSVNLDRITVTMQTTAGNAYQGCGITFDVQVRAIQYNFEKDGFSNPDYDINADGTPDHPEFGTTITGVNTTVTVPGNHTTGNYVYTNGDGSVEVTIPNAEAGDKYNISVKPADTTMDLASNQGAQSFDISVQDSGDKDVPATIELKVDPGMPNVKVYHEGTEMAATTYRYDSTTGVLTIDATSYSIYTVRYEYLASIKGYYYASLKDAFAAAKDGDTVVMLADEKLSIPEGTGKKALTTVKAQNVTLDMNGKKLSVDSSNITGSPMMISVDGGSLTIIGNGTIDAEATSTCYAIDVINNGKLTINNGTFTGAPTAVQVKTGEATILGGTFKLATSCENADDTLARYLINCIDANWKNGTAVVSIKGGSFKGFDPANAAGENPVGKFTALGYGSVEKSGVYTVVLADYYMEDDNTYVIQTPQGLMDFAADVNSGNSYAGKTVKLGCDIDLNNVAWEPIGQTIAINGNEKAYNFLGSFDGQNYTIKNLNVNADGQTNDLYASGFFGFLDARATIKNLKIDTANVKGHHWVAVICGYTQGSIENCHVTNATVVNTHINDEACGDKTGVIVGYTAGAVKNCSAKDCTVTVDGRDAGQIAGKTEDPALLTDCTAENVVVTAVENGECNRNGENVRNELIGREN